MLPEFISRITEAPWHLSFGSRTGYKYQKITTGSFGWKGQQIMRKYILMNSSYRLDINKSQVLG